MVNISVVIPNYNQTHFIRTAIQSVLDQTYRSFEIIVVDDGSTDNSREVIAQFGDQVRYIWQENQGLGGARNTGIRAATGEFIGLLDADDQWQPNFLETMMAIAEQAPDAALYFCRAQGMNTDGRLLPQIFGGQGMSSHLIYQKLLRANFLIPSTVLMRRSVVMAAGLFEQTERAIHGCEDWDLWLRIAPKHKFVGTSASLVRYRLHDNTFSAKPTHMQNAVRAVIEKHFGPDDGQWSTWSQEKCRAYGGVYRYHTLTFVQRQNDWKAATPYLQCALQIDATLATDIDLFYDLALGAQPVGYRGTDQHIDISMNACAIQTMLTGIFDGGDNRMAPLRRQVYGTAFCALGLVAYNSGRLAESRRYLIKALYYRPDLWRDNKVFGNLLKSLAGHAGLLRLRQLRSVAKLS